MLFLLKIKYISFIQAVLLQFYLKLNKNGKKKNIPEMFKLEFNSGKLLS